jgi:outer membrane protein assembly factor BamB
LGLNIGDSCDDNDDTTTGDVVTADCGCVGTPVEQFDCPNLDADFGDPCETVFGGDGFINDDCQCLPDPTDGFFCQDWVVYYADIADNGVTDIYSVEITGDEAVLSLIATSDIEVHIAYNDFDKLIYAVSNQDGSYRTLDPEEENPTFSATNVIDADVSRITAAAFSNDGYLYIGSADMNTIYEVNINTNDVLTFDASAPVSGGDLEFDESGNLYLATRDNGGELIFGEEVISAIPNVTGMALSSENSLLISSTNSSQLMVRELDGTSATSLDLALSTGESFITNFGDLASGCANIFIPDEGECEDFSTYYMDNVSNSPVLYEVLFGGTNAVVIPIYDADFRAHIAFDAHSNVIYLVNRNGNNIHIVDPQLGFLGEVLIEGDLNNAYAAVYNQEDGLLYIGDSNSDEIYTVNPTNGETFFYANVPVEGGDLAIQNGTLYLVERTARDLYEIVSPSEINLISEVPTNISGMAQANNSNSLILSKANSDLFIEIGTDGTELQEYSAVLLSGEPFVLDNGGDMAAGCASSTICEDPFPAVEVASLSATPSENGVLLEWEPVDGQIGCQIQGRTADGTPVGAKQIFDQNINSFFVLGAFLEPDTDYEWRVRCGCSLTPLIVGPWTPWVPFTTLSNGEIESNPNPTDGISNVTFSVMSNGNATLEVYDMSGRLVETIFNGVVSTETDYRFQFDGTYLQNGVYIYRLTTANEVIIDKFMIAK